MITTATHNMGNGTKVGSTPDFSIPSSKNMNALEVLGEGIVLMLSGERGEIDVVMKDGRIFRITAKTAEKHPPLILGVESV